MPSGNSACARLPQEPRSSNVRAEADARTPGASSTRPEGPGCLTTADHRTHAPPLSQAQQALASGQQLAPSGAPPSTSAGGAGGTPQRGLSSPEAAAPLKEH